jgi:hypothetical protein
MCWWNTSKVIFDIGTMSNSSSFIHETIFTTARREPRIGRIFAQRIFKKVGLAVGSSRLPLFLFDSFYVVHHMLHRDLCNVFPVLTPRKESGCFRNDGCILWTRASSQCSPPRRQVPTPSVAEIRIPYATYLFSFSSLQPFWCHHFSLRLASSLSNKRQCLKAPILPSVLVPRPVFKSETNVLGGRVRHG